MKTYEITATLHDGRVVYSQKIEGLDVMNAIVLFIGTHTEQAIKIQTLNVKEVTT